MTSSHIQLIFNGIISTFSVLDFAYMWLKFVDEGKRVCGKIINYLLPKIKVSWSKKKSALLRIIYLKWNKYYYATNKKKWVRIHWNTDRK